MINKIFSIYSFKSQGIRKNFSSIYGKDYFNSESCYVTKTHGFSSHKIEGYFEDNEIIVLADSNILGEPRTKGDLYTQKDTESAYIAKLYKLYKYDIIKHIEGAFTFIVWDKKEQVLFGARDRIGIRNLFYSYVSGHGFIVSTKLKEICKVDFFDKRLDVNAIYHYLFIKSFEQPSTPFLKVKSLLPGHYFTVKDGELDIQKYWDINIHRKSKESITSATNNLKNKIDYYLRNFFSKNMLGSSAIMLSGGLDSSYLTAIMSKLSNKPVNTFTIKFGDEGKRNDESYYARLVSKRLNTNHTEVIIDDELISQKLNQYISSLDTPVANSGYKLLAIIDLPEIADIDYIFSGEGADTLFGLDSRWEQYEKMEKILLPMRLIPESIREIIYSIFMKITKRLVTKIDSKYIRGIHRYLFTKSGYFLWKGSAISESSLKKLFVEKNKLTSIKYTYRNHFRNSGAQNLIDKLNYMGLKTYAPNQQLTHYTSLCSQSEIEPIYPFLDVDLIEYCLSLPEKFKSKKFILTNIAEDIVPKSIINRPKEGFVMPFDTWLNGKLKPMVDNAFLKSTVEKRGLFDYKELNKVYKDYYNNHPYNKVPWVDVWSFVILECWLSEHLDEKNK